MSLYANPPPNENGRPVRDPGSTSFVGAIETSEDFGERIEAEAIRRGTVQLLIRS